MDNYIEHFSFLVRNGDMQNTYKAGWARAIVESCVLNPEKSRFHFEELAQKVFGYYWNQSIFFALEQSPNPSKRPEIHQIVVEEIERYQQRYGFKPEWFSKIEHLINVPVTRISNVLNKDVCWRFLKVADGTYNIYELDRKNRTISVLHPELLRKHADTLFDLINYRWTQKLEDFNHVPRVSKKVQGTDRERIRRGSLSKFRKYLDLENPKRECFLTGKPLSDSDLSIDHVLPWSYLYSDDLWNLVYVDKSRNSSKSNRIPDEILIEKLEVRNRRLLGLVQGGKFDDKHTDELELSIQNNWIRKFWVGCKG